MTEISRIKKELGRRVIIAAHHYQRPEITALADLIGDSYRLGVESAKTGADFIVLCGVRFMAESVAILAADNQQVLLPDHDAGCPMADMIDREAAAKALAFLSAAAGTPVVPVTYMNSWADLKALTGEAGGSICTSGNARKIVKHFLDAGSPVLFMPDFNLGINTASELGLSDNQIRTVRRDGTLTGTDDPAEAKIFLWDGFCKVHKTFTETDVAEARRTLPLARILVHPECSREVVSLSDGSGSTETLCREIENAPSGSTLVIGTEARFVDRMIATWPDKKIYHLRQSFCHNMNRIDLGNLQSTLEAVERHAQTGERLDRITVSDCDKQFAAAALRAMVRITEAP